MGKNNKIFTILKLAVFTLLIVFSCISYVTEKRSWELGEYLFNNTILISGIVGIFLELYKK